MTHNLGDNSLVTVTAGHLITHLELALLGDDYFGHFHDACRQFVSNADGELLTAVYPHNVANLNLVVMQQCIHQSVSVVVGSPGTPREVGVVNHGVERLEGVFSAFRNNVFIEVVDHALAGFSAHKLRQFVDEYGANGFQVCYQFKIKLLEIFFVSDALALVFHAATEQLLVNNYPTDARRRLERSIFNVACLVAKDGAKQFLFGRWVALALGRDFTNHNVAWNNLCSNTDQSVLVKVFGSFFADIRNICRQFFHSQLGVANVQ